MRKLFIALLFLSIASLACSLGSVTGSSPAAATEDPGLVATLVAGQLTQAAESASGAESGAGEPAGSETSVSAAPAGSMLITYASGGNIYLWQGGAARQLTFSGRDDRPRISQDGQVLAFERDGELLAVNADGSGERVLVSRAYLETFRTPDLLAINVSQFAFVPGTRDLFFDLVGETEAYPALYYDIHKVNADAPAPAQLNKPGEGGRWTFSPDGQWVAIAAPQQINLMRVDGSEFRQALSYPMVSTYSEWFYLPEVVWLETSAGFYTVIPAPAILENPTEPARFYYVPLGGGPARLAEFVTAPVWEGFPYIAPNGAQVLYLRRVGDNAELHVIDASTADRLVISAPTLGLLGWNPNSREFVYYTDLPATARLSSPEAVTAPLGDGSVRFGDLRWLNDDDYLFISDQALKLGNARTGVISTLASPVTYYDFWR